MCLIFTKVTCVYLNGDTIYLNIRIGLDYLSIPLYRFLDLNKSRLPVGKIKSATNISFSIGTLIYRAKCNITALCSEPTYRKRSLNTFIN